MAMSPSIRLSVRHCARLLLIAVAVILLIASGFGGNAELGHAQTAPPAKRFRPPATLPLTGFYDYTYMPDSVVGRPDSVERLEYAGGGIEASDGMRFRVSLYNASFSGQESVWLVPMGGTILRQVTFPVKP